MGDKQEVWVLRFIEGGRFCGPALDDDGTDSFLAWPSKEQAEQGKKFSEDMYGLEDLEVVQLLPGEPVAPPSAP